MDEAWTVGADFTLRPLVVEEMIHGSIVRQLAIPERVAQVIAVGDKESEVSAGGEAVRVLLKHRPGEADPYLVASISAKRIQETKPAQLVWAGAPKLMRPEAVVDRLRGVFQLVDGGVGGSGFRTPQLGAVHSVLGYWTTEPDREATVVMPTGTGKTDTMVALFAAVCPPRLLVVVPSDALRTQVAEKFEQLGVLVSIGALPGSTSTFPLVGRLGKGIKRASHARKLARACNVLVTTPNAFAACSDDAKAALVSEFSHLFVDEAHHVRATTWESIRNRFAGKIVLQFTATPYREDGRELGGRLVYVFPLRLAQQQGYFSRINYVGVRSLAGEDIKIAQAAVSQLRTDLAAGLDHIVMARVRTRRRADQVVEIYREIASNFGPRVLYSGLKPASAKKEALAALGDRSCRVVVCVDMLGEGFDLPSLKIAAIHDAHKSLGITLQFIGRFARVASDVGEATAIVGRPDTIGGESLRALYAEDPDWNLIIRDLSEAATESEEEASEFEEGFQNVPVGAATHQLRPKLSAVVYRTRCEDWRPEAAIDMFGETPVITKPLPHNPTTGVAWFIVRLEGREAWGPEPGYLNVGHELYLMYWDRSLGLLYVNSSNNDSTDKHHQRLAEAVAGKDVERIRGDAVFRTFGGVERAIPTNVGLLDIRSRGRRHAQYAGHNTYEGFPEGEKGTKTQTNIFAHGFRDGERIQLGASLKGRVWSRANGTVHDWMRWCDETGARLTDPTLSIDEILANFIRPELLEKRPNLVVLAVEWPADAYTSLTGDARLANNDQETPLIDVELRVIEFSETGPIKVDVDGGDWTVPYEIHISDRGIEALPASSAVVDVVTTSRRRTLSDYVADKGLTLLCEDEAVIEPPGVLYRPNRTLPPFPTDNLRTHVPWDKVDLKVESQGKDRKSNSIQRRVIDQMIERGKSWCKPSTGPKAEPWELVIDDDGSNELADVVGLRRTAGTLHVELVHCKYSSETTPGARVEDLYEVCGQAQKSVARRREIHQLIPHLLRRERQRQSQERSGFELGDEEVLYDIEANQRLLRLALRIVVVQPGVSAAKVSTAQLDLLAATEMYVLDVGGAEFEVVVSP